MEVDIGTNLGDAGIHRFFQRLQICRSCQQSSANTAHETGENSKPKNVKIRLMLLLPSFCLYFCVPLRLGLPAENEQPMIAGTVSELQEFALSYYSYSTVDTGGTVVAPPKLLFVVVRMVRNGHNSRSSQTGIRV